MSAVDKFADKIAAIETEASKPSGGSLAPDQQAKLREKRRADLRYKNALQRDLAALPPEQRAQVEAAIAAENAKPASNESALKGVEVPRPPMPRYLDEVAACPRPPVRTYATGIEDLDRLLGGGIHTGQVVGVLGPPSLGKSAYVGSTLLHVQMQLPVLHVSTELEADELMCRYAAHRLDVPWRDAVRGAIDREQLRDAVRGLRIRVVGCDELPREEPLEAIEAAAYAMAVEHNVAPAIAIDYVQLLARGGEDGIRARVAELTARIRAMAQRLTCPVLAVFSVGRHFYTEKKRAELRATDDPRAYLGAAKECGDVEYDCATILFLDVGDAEPGRGDRDASIAVARCRYGEEGFAGAVFTGSNGRWVGDSGARARLIVGTEAKRDRQAEARVQQLVALVRDALGRGDLRTKSQWQNARTGVPDIKGTMEVALRTGGPLRQVTTHRFEGAKRQERTLVVPADYVLPDDVAPLPAVDPASLASRMGLVR